MARTPIWVVLGGVCLLLGRPVLVQNERTEAPPPKVAKPAVPAAALTPPPRHDSGFTAAFEEEVRKVGQITPDEFGRRFAGKARYLPKISWDPTTAKYWDRFTLDPNDPKAMTPIRNITPGAAAHLYDFRLQDKELAVLKDRGFVVSERLGSHSFTDLYYRIYVRDLPVFVSSDSLLHAWHRYFDRLLESLETDYFRPSF